MPVLSAVQHNDAAQYDTRWRILSGLAFVMLGLVLIWFFTNDSFYVRAIQASGLNWQTEGEIFAFSEAADYHIFWLDTGQIRASIMRSALVVDATVELGWPPYLIDVQVQERQPAILWSEGGRDIWVDLQGRVMPVRAEIPGLLRVNAADGALSGQRQLDRDTVLGALQLREILPPGAALDYNSVYGLGWKNDRAWQIWVGFGAGMDEKIRIYEFLLNNLTGRGIEVEELNLANADAPFYRLR